MATQHDEYLDRISEIHDTNEQVNQALSRVEAAVNQQLDNSDAMVKQLQDIFAWMQEHGPPPQSPAQNSRPPDTTNTNLRSDPENSNSGQGPECLPHKPPLELNSILYLTLGRRSSQCVRGCPCACHIRPHQRSWKLPGLVRNVLGSLFVGYAASPTTPVKCSVKTCVRDRRTRLTVTYAFPLWFLGYVVRGVVERTAAGTISLGLVPCRRVPATMRASNILWAASSGSLEDVRVILRSSPAVVTDISASEGSSVLIHALTGCCSWESRLSIVQTLLVQGADPDMPNDSGVSPRLYIAYISMLRLVPEEIRPGMERLFPLQETVESLELTYLHEVVLGRCNAALEEVLKTRDRAILSQVNEKDAMGVTPLMYAAKLGNEGHVRALLDAGADVNTENNYGETALCLASANVLHLLIGAGADVNSATKYHKVTPLHHAAAADDPVVLEQLLSAGANIEQQTADGSTAVHYAAQCNSTRALTVLHKHNANINARDLWGKTPLMVAICYNAHNALDTLLSLNADYLSLTKRKWNILCYAAYYGDVETLNILAKCKLDISPWRRIENKIEYAVKVFHIRRRISQEVSEAFGKFLASLRKHSQEDDRGDPDYSIILAENNEMVESEAAKANGNGNDKIRRNKKGDDSEEDED
ncbi:hypothetical protein VTJ04DRAFT_8545, partial [Mycothermus thermophilus]|uniref:uncharacterized protein n=1 Tax=Humicola insolens TaxID=85995 RepID=UPI003743B0F7